MSTTVQGKVQVGLSGTSTNNFHFRNLLDGLLRLSRGSHDAASPVDVLRVATDNSVGFPSGIRGEAANVAPVFKDGNGIEIGTLCRAWVNFNGIGTVAIRGHFNVSSITDRGTGAYTVNFANALPDANYATQLSGRRTGTVTSGFVNIAATGEANAQYNSTGVLVYTMSGDGTGLDYETVCVSVFR